MASVDAFCTFLTSAVLVFLSGNTNSQELGFIQNPQDVIISKRDEFTWDCIPRPNSEGSIGKVTWYKDGNTLEFDNYHRLFSNGSLYFSSIRGKKSGLSDDGLYQCCVNKNISGIIGIECSNKASLTIAVKPVITSNPEHVLTRLGGVARFYCEIEAVPPASVRWEHGRTAIGDDEGSGVGVESKFTVLPGGALQVIDITYHEAGEYRCLVQNIGGRRQSQPAILSINSSLPQPTDVKFIKCPEDIVRKHHMSAILECLADFPDSYSVSWIHRKKGGKLVPLSNRASSFGQSNLMLRDLSLDDSGIYACQVLNERGNMVSERLATLTVVAPPIIEQPPEEENGILGRSVRLRCKAFGVPQPKIMWYKNGEVVNLYGRFSMVDNSELVVSSTQINDSGIYQCFAENYVGSTQAATLVKFMINPGRPLPPFDIQVVPRDSESFLVTWRQPPNPYTEGHAVHYMIDGGKDHSILVGMQYSGVVAKLNPYTNYTIYVISFNSKGISDPSEYVYAQTQPDKPTDVLKFSLASNFAGSLDVKWQKMSLEYANGIIIRYNIQYRHYGNKTYKEIEVDGKENQTVIDNLRPGWEYEVRISAATVIGNGPWSGWTKQRTLKSGTSLNDITAPDMRITFVNQSMIFVKWELVQGNIIGYKISYYTVNGIKAGPILLPANITNYIIMNLKPLSTCTVSLLAFSESKDGSKTVQTITTHTASGMPWDPSVMPTPVNFSATAKSSTVVHLMWDWPFTNFEVTNYIVKYAISGSPIIGVQDEQPNFFHYIPERSNVKQSVFIEGLEPFTLYTFAIQVEGEDGVSTFSQQVNCRTSPNKPSSPPTNVNARPLDAHTVEMRWHPPVEPNGPILTYIIMYNINESQPEEKWQRKEKTVPRQYDDFRDEDHLTEINNLVSNTKYYFRMRARNNNGDSPPTKIVSVLTLVDQAVTLAPDKDTEQLSETTMGVLLGIGVVFICIILCAVFMVVARRYVNKQAQRYREFQAGNDLLAERVQTYINQSSCSEGHAQLEQLLPMLRHLSQPNDIHSKDGSGITLMMQQLSPLTSSGHQMTENYHSTSAASSKDVIETHINHEPNEHNLNSSLHAKSLEGSSQDTGISTCHGEQDSPKNSSVYRLQKVWQQEFIDTSSESSNQSLNCTINTKSRLNTVCPTMEKSGFIFGGNGSAIPRVFNMSQVREYTV